MGGNERSGVVETIFGRPRPWTGWLWLAMGVVWGVLAVSGGRAYEYVAAVVWIVAGVGMLVAGRRTRSRDPR